MHANPSIKRQWQSYSTREIRIKLCQLEHIYMRDRRRNVRFAKTKQHTLNESTWINNTFNIIFISMNQCHCERDMLVLCGRACSLTSPYRKGNREMDRESESGRDRQQYVHGIGIAIEYVHHTSLVYCRCIGDENRNRIFSVSLSHRIISPVEYLTCIIARECNDEWS